MQVFLALKVVPSHPDLFEHGAPRAKPVVATQEYPSTPLGAEALPPSRSPLRAGVGRSVRRRQGFGGVTRQWQNPPKQ